MAALRKTAMAIGAHPDDIEFCMAGTLLKLRDAGWEIHALNLATGNCGSAVNSAAKTRRTRGAEARAAAKELGAAPPAFRMTWNLLLRFTLRQLAASFDVHPISSLIRRKIT